MSKRHYKYLFELWRFWFGGGVALIIYGWWPLGVLCFICMYFWYGYYGGYFMPVKQTNGGETDHE